MRSLRTPFYLGVAGDTAGYVDLEHSLGTHLPLVLALVVASTLVVLFLMTGSLVLGVKAVLMNALSLSAVFGILVLIFQHGSLQGLLSYRSTGPLDATQPILLFAIAFGLATDYGVSSSRGSRRRMTAVSPTTRLSQSDSSAPDGS